MKKFIAFSLSSIIATSISLASGATISAIENAGLTGTGPQDESTKIDLRDRFGYVGQASERYAYVRFAMDAASDTFGGFAVADIQSVTLDLNFIGATRFDTGKVFVLQDNADLGSPFLTETSWAATGTNELSGPIAPHGNQDATTSSLLTEIGNFSTLSGSDVFFQLSLDLATFQSIVTSSTNNEFTFVITGPKDANNVIASLGNGTLAGPALTIAIPEPSTLALMGIALLGALALKRRKA